MKGATVWPTTPKVSEFGWVKENILPSKSNDLTGKWSATDSKYAQMLHKPVTYYWSLFANNDKTTFLPKNWVSQNVTKRGLHTICHRMCVAPENMVIKVLWIRQKTAYLGERIYEKVFSKMLTNLTNYFLHTIRISYKFQLFATNATNRTNVRLFCLYHLFGALRLSGLFGAKCASQ